MKHLLKRFVPHALWEGVRRRFFFARRYLLDLVACAHPNPIRWLRVFRLARYARPRYSMVPSRRLRLLYDLSTRVETERVPGAVVECGVYNGGSAVLMQDASARAGGTRDLWLFDSFEGLPPPTDKDGEYEREHYFKGWCGGTKDMVLEAFDRARVSRKKLHIVEGWFDKTFPTEIPKIGSIALLHIDCDWYESVKICLENLYPLVSPGGYIEFDDYGTFEGCRKAVHEYIDKHNIKVTLETNDGVGRHFRKPH